MNSKITDEHQSKFAYIYLRQSTPAQILHHQESTERQYALREKALELGWSEATVRTLDRDLGISGAQTTGRTTTKGVSPWTQMKKYKAQWLWSSACFAKRAAPLE